MHPLLKPLSEQVIVLTGASSGIGLATAQLAAEHGARLVLLSRSGEVLQSLVDMLEDDGHEAIHVVADVGRREEVERAARQALKHFGRIDTWVNNAGVPIDGHLHEVSEADHRRLFDTHFRGVVNGSRVALPLLGREGGALINVGGEVSDAVVPLQGMDSASKHAVKGFTDALRVQVEGVGKAPVSITLIQPTVVDTPFPQRARNSTDREPKLPSPRIDPVEVARAILHAAVSGGRDVRVGMRTTLHATAPQPMPGRADRRSARQARRPHFDQLPADPQDTLHCAGAAGHIHGERPVLH
jgi:NAD(P)-dependent dehydrogenase (short-subunit alcohol dehydrogenase family)